MKHLSRLTPAETLLILKGDQMPLSDLLKYSFMDLLLKQVLAIREVQRQASSRDPIRIHKYVVTGSSFGTYQVKPHELAFLSIFQTNPESSVLFKNLVKIAYQNAKNQKHYYTRLTASPNLKDALRKSLFQRITGNFSYTEKGLIIKKEIENEFSELEKIVSEQPSSDSGKAVELLKSIGGNIFLSNVLEFEISKDFERELFEQMTKRDSAAGCGAGCWTAFGHYSESFDGSCSSDSGTGCSGGDSGCSGCSGCGGD